MRKVQKFPHAQRDFSLIVFSNERKCNTLNISENNLNKLIERF